MNDNFNLKMAYTPDEEKKITAWEKAKANVRAKKKELKKEQIKLKKEKVKKTVKGVIKKVMTKNISGTNLLGIKEQVQEKVA